MKKRTKPHRIAPTPEQTELQKRCKEDAQEAIQSIQRATADHPYSAPTLIAHTRNLARFALFLAQSGGTLRTANKESAISFLESLSNQKLSQTTINLYRQAIEAMFLSDGRESEISSMLRVSAQVGTNRKDRRIQGAYSRLQIDFICKHLSSQYALGTRILYETGMRAEEILTLRPRTEHVPDEGLDGENGLIALPRDLLIGKENCVPYTVVNKQRAGVGNRKEGKAVRREVWIPAELAKELETYRRPEPVIVSDLGNKYESFYSIHGGTRLTKVFSLASRRAFGWSLGVTGIQCAYAQDRAIFLRKTINFVDVLGIITIEMGNSSDKATERLLV